MGGEMKPKYLLILLLAAVIGVPLLLDYRIGVIESEKAARFWAEEEAMGVLISERCATDDWQCASEVRLEQWDACRDRLPECRLPQDRHP